jgi:hypothetical protein
MSKSVFRVVGLDHATCDSQYCGSETATRPVSAGTFVPKIFNPLREEPSAVPAVSNNACNVSVRVSDVLPALQQAASDRLAWIKDFADDPVMITRDLYDVLLTYQRLKRAA